MKPLALFTLCVIFFASCKKESTDDNQQQQSFAANEALVNPSAIGYIIADVEGLEGVDKINYQVTEENPSGYFFPYYRASAGNGACPSGMKEHDALIDCYPAENLFIQLSVAFRYLCPGECPMTDMVKTGNPDFMTETNGEGIMISYWAGNITTAENTVYYSQTYNNNSDPESSLEVVSLVKNPLPLSSHEVTVRFNATLTTWDKTKTIKLKNAIYKSFIGLIH